MKKTLWLVTAVLLLLLGTSACGNSSDPHVGRWNAVSISALGLTVDVEAAFLFGASLDLKSNGKCTVTLDGDSAAGEWSFVDDALTITAGGESYTAYIEDGVLTLPVPRLALDVNFEKQGDVPSPAPQA